MKRAFTMLTLGLSFAGCMTAIEKDDTDHSPIDRFTAEGVTSYAYDSAEGQALRASFAAGGEQSAGPDDDVGVVTSPFTIGDEDYQCSSRDGSTDCFCST